MIKFYTIMLWACIAYWGITPQLAAQENLVPEGATEIKDMEFKDRTDLTEVVIPEGVTRIGKYAFYNCTNMSSIKLPSSLISIDDYAFFHVRNFPPSHCRRTWKPSGQTHLSMH